MGKHTRLARRPFAFVLVALLVVFGNTLASVGVLAQQTTVTGTFTTEFVDPLPGSGGSPVVYYHLTESTGKTIALQVAPGVLQAAGGRLALDHQRVTVIGTPGPATQANTSPVLAVQTIEPANRTVSLPKRQVTGGQPFVNVLCKFSDVATEPKAPAYFDGLMGNGPAALGEFFSQVSFGNISLTGTQTVGWFTLPQPKSYYVQLDGTGGPTDAALNLMFDDCAALIPNTINMAPIAGLNLMFNDLLGNAAVGGTGRTKTINGVTKLWPTTWMPPWGYYPAPGYTGGQTVLAHEMGHAFGLSHSAGPTGVTYQNSWDVLSDTYTYCAKLTDPTYGCLGQHMIAFDKDFENWIPAGQKFTYAGVSQTLTFGALADATTPNYYYGVIPHIGTATQFTTVEFRRLLGYDQKLAGNAVIIHEVDTTRTDPAWVQGTNGTTGAMFTAGMTYTAPNSNNVKVTVNAIGATTATVTIGATAPTLRSITVSPANAAVKFGSTLQFTATGVYLDNSTQNLTGTVVWASTAPGVATITAGGLVTAVAPGATTITATSGVIVGQTTLNVTVDSLPPGTRYVPPTGPPPGPTQGQSRGGGGGLGPVDVKPGSRP